MRKVLVLASVVCLVLMAVCVLPAYPRPTYTVGTGYGYSSELETGGSTSIATCEFGKNGEADLLIADNFNKSAEAMGVKGSIGASSAAILIGGKVQDKRWKASLTTGIAWNSEKYSLTMPTVLGGPSPTETISATQRSTNWAKLLAKVTYYAGKDVSVNLGYYDSGVNDLKLALATVNWTF